MAALLRKIRPMCKTLSKSVIILNVSKTSGTSKDFVRFSCFLQPYARSHSENSSRRHVGPILYAGILSTMLGLDKEQPKEETDEDRLIHSVKLGVYAMQQGELDKSEFLLHVALRMAMDLQHEYGITYIFAILADLALKQADYGKSERLYLSVLERELARGVPKDANSVVDISLKLAQIYKQTNQLEKAEKGFLFCIETQEKKIKSEDFIQGEEMEDTLGLWGMSRDWYGTFLLDQKRFSEAFHQFSEAYKICLDTYGESHSQTQVLLNSLGTVASLMGKNTEAVNYYRKAVDIGRQHESDNLPTFLINLGMAQIKSSLLEEAEKNCRDAKRMSVKNKLEEEQNEAQNCIDLATKKL